ncbi:MAG: tetratricopeptide repeat protein [Planctomycetota bacterium]
MAKHTPKDSTKPSYVSAALAGPIAVLISATIILAGLIAYSSSFGGQFMLDDFRTVYDNPKVVRFQPLDGDSWARLLKSRRAVAEITFAVNHWSVREFLDVEHNPANRDAHPTTGYHAVNIGIHIASALLLFGLIRRTLLLPSMRETFAGASPWLAGAVALLWVVHPLTTQGVTYICQRSESLMSFFYIGMLYCVCRLGFPGARLWLWGSLAVIACALGMGTKGIMVTAPFAALLYDRCFIAGSFKEALRKRAPIYIGVAATLSILFITGVATGVFSLEPSKTKVGFGYRDVTPLEYLLTQQGVLMKYLQLTFWPRHLLLDYQWPHVDTSDGGQVISALGFGVVILSLLAGTIYLLWKRPAAGFLPAMFFLILLPTSSFVPISDALFEHRMYLAVAAVIGTVVFGAWWVIRKAAGDPPPLAGIAVLLLLLLGSTTGLSIRTYQRNTDYSNEIVMLQQAVELRTTTSRARNNLGFQVARTGDEFSSRADATADPQQAAVLRGQADRLYAEALRLFTEACEANPTNPRLWYNRANTLVLMDRDEEAIEMYQEAERLVREDPTGRKYPAPFVNHAIVLYEDAERRIRRARGENRTPERLEQLASEATALLDETQALYEEALERSRQRKKVEFIAESKDARYIAKAHNGLGNVAYQRANILPNDDLAGKAALVRTALQRYRLALAADPGNRPATGNIERAQDWLLRLETAMLQETGS